MSSTDIAPLGEILIGKTVLVTGAGGGLGARLARRFAQAGADVAVCDLKYADATLELIKKVGVKGYAATADVADPASVTALFDEVTANFGFIDILINNAGIYPNAEILSMTPEQWDQTIDVDLKSVFLCTQAAARKMVEAGKGGSIVNIGSIDATNPLYAHSHYSAAKAGVIAFTRAAAQELGKHSIRVNSVSPGLINRPGLAEAWPDGYNRFMARTPIGRVGEPEDIADACIFLASDAARWVTGTNLIVDGGVQSLPMF
jgi:NAD(P)-dependent dehydrogenase (short-subunit alcohol dehydrogenase family)